MRLLKNYRVTNKRLTVKYVMSNVAEEELRGRGNWTEIFLRKTMGWRVYTRAERVNVVFFLACRGS